MIHHSQKTKLYNLLILTVLVSITIALFILPAPSFIPSFPHADKIFHFSFFTTLSYLTPKLFNSSHPTFLFISILALAISAETLQLLSITRTFDLLDLLANIIGVMVGWILVSFQNNTPLDQPTKNN